MIEIYLSGFFLSLGLIMAIGMQNAFVIKQGLKQESVLLTVITCTVADSFLIAIGVTGMGVILASNSILRIGLTLLGCGFLLYYAFNSFKDAKKGDLHLTLDSSTTKKGVVLTALAFSLLNPLAIMDTTVLIGTASVAYHPNQWYFGFGAMTGSLIWFTSLAIFARLIVKYANKPIVWRIIYIIIGLICTITAIKLLYSLKGLVSQTI